MGLEQIRKEMNFRELGGLPVSGGRTVRNGVFYRTGALGLLNEEELAFVRTLGIRSVFDLRSAYERKLTPDPELPGAVNYPISALTDRSGNEVDLSPEAIKESTQHANHAENASNFLEMMYGGLPFAAAYRKMFEEIEAGNVPVLFHCSAGKDRTGIGAALILLALGADEQTVLDDYMMTNEYRMALIERFLEDRKEILDQHPEFRAILMGYEGVNRSSAEYALKSILKEYPSYDAYFEAQFGLDHARRERLRELYTENAEV